MFSVCSRARSRNSFSLCVLFAALWRGGFCMNLENLDGRLLRNERGGNVKRLQLGANGQVFNAVANESGSAANDTESGTNEPHTAWGEPRVPDLENLENHDEPCDLDFPFGIQNSNSCDNRSTYGDYSNITQSQCIFAAEKAGAMTIPGSFVIPFEWQDVRPRGCYVFPCETHSWCYYANEDGDMPHGSIYGRPVCRRNRYIHGTAVPDANVNDPRMCPFSDYEVIESAENCRKASKCLGDCEGNRFNIGQIHEADKDIYPPGCFLHQSSPSERACVYWNNPMLSGSLFAPRTPVGTPICVVSKPDHVSDLKKSEFSH